MIQHKLAEEYLAPLHTEAQRLKNVFIRAGYPEDIFQGSPHKGTQVTRDVRRAFVYYLMRYARRERYNPAEVAGILGSSYMYTVDCYRAGREALTGNNRPTLRRIIEEIEKINQEKGYKNGNTKNSTVRD